MHHSTTAPEAEAEPEPEVEDATERSLTESDNDLRFLHIFAVFFGIFFIQKRPLAIMLFFIMFTIGDIVLVFCIFFFTAIGILQNLG